MHEELTATSLVEIELKQEDLENRRTLFKNDSHWVRRDSRILRPKVTGRQRLPFPPRMDSRESETVSDTILSENLEDSKIENFQDIKTVRWADEGRTIPNVSLSSTFQRILP